MLYLDDLLILALTDQLKSLVHENWEVTYYYDWQNFFWLWLLGLCLAGFCCVTCASICAWVRSLTVGLPMHSWLAHMRKLTRQPGTALRRVKSMTNSVPFPALSYPIFWLIEVSCAPQSSIVVKGGWQEDKNPYCEPCCCRCHRQWHAAQRTTCSTYRCPWQTSPA